MRESCTVGRLRANGHGPELHEAQMTFQHAVLDAGRLAQDAHHINALARVPQLGAALLPELLLLKVAFDGPPRPEVPLPT